MPLAGIIFGIKAPGGDAIRNTAIHWKRENKLGCIRSKEICGADGEEIQKAGKRILAFGADVLYMVEAYRHSDIENCISQKMQILKTTLVCGDFYVVRW